MNSSLNRAAKVTAALLVLCAPAARLHAKETAPADVTVMEQMIVEATSVEAPSGIMAVLRPRPLWLYTSIPGYEVLSKCDSDQTLAATRHLGDSLNLDRDFVPPDYRASPAVPMSFIMFDHPPSQAMAALIPGSLTSDVGSDTVSFGIYHLPFTLAAGGTDVSDADTHCAVQNRWGMAWAYAGGGLGRGPIPTGLQFEISQVRPALPLWYQYAFIGPCGLLRIATGSNSIILAAASWVSEPQTVEFIARAKRSGTAPPLPPIEDLFRQKNAGDDLTLTDWPSPEWMAEAALFSRWGLYSGGRKRAFETFVERSRRERVTEAMFRECFGFGYAAMQDVLSRYLEKEGRDPVLVDIDSLAHWRPNNDPNNPPFPLLSCREATPSEIARLLGDWERMEGDSKRASDPALSSLFLRQAGKTLTHGYDEGARDPAFLAVMGLYDVDIGDTADARPLLKTATNTGVIRPAAYVALSQILLDEAKAHPGSKQGMSPDQTAAVLSPLFAARKASKLDSAGYRLVAEAWIASSGRPTLGNLGAVKEGTELYPFDGDLACLAAKAYAHWGYWSETRQLIATEMKSANAEAGTRLAEIEASLGKNASGQ